MNVTMNTIAACTFIACLWGCSNPFLNRSGRTSIKKSHIISTSKSNTTTTSPTPHRTLTTQIRRFASDIYALLCDWRFLLPLAANQCGSLLYIKLLSDTDLSVAMPLTNGLTFITTAITSYMLRETQSVDVYTLAGGAFILAGFAVSLSGKNTHEGMH